MFKGKRLALVCVAIAALSYWAFQQLRPDEADGAAGLAHYPQYYMEDFSALGMNQDGAPKHRLKAVYMAHYPQDDTSELREPELELFRADQPPVVISADKGWVMSDNDIILLKGNVRLWLEDAGGARLTLLAEDARLLVEAEYAETARPVRLSYGRMVTEADGLRAYLAEERMELTGNVQTRIAPEP